jgi:putative SOS response-associated peptidase YedK
LWENWRDKAAGDGAEWIRTCVIISGPPNELVPPIHDRMPVILPQEAWARWLGEEAADRDDAIALEAVSSRADEGVLHQHTGEQREE